MCTVATCRQLCTVRLTVLRLGKACLILIGIMTKHLKACFLLLLPLKALYIHCEGSPPSLLQVKLILHLLYLRKLLADWK